MDINSQRMLLNGEWDFTYTKNFGYTIPGDDRFKIKMPVPGYWDNNIDRIQTSDFWASAVFNPGYKHIVYPMGGNSDLPDASLPYLTGVGWYRKILNIPLCWKSAQVFLTVGGVVLEAWIYVNGSLAAYHGGHSTAFEAPLSDLLKFGEENELVIAVANTRTDRLGCDIRGFKGFGAGIKGPVSIEAKGELYISDCFLHPASDIDRIKWNITLKGILRPGYTLEWSILEPRTKKTECRGSLSVTGTLMEWISDSADIAPWSDDSPNLYEVRLTLRRGGDTIDVHTQAFGLRLLERDGAALRLNGRPKLLRGATEHAYYPLTCAPPSNVEAYRENIRKLKEIGFNWLRFHTWVPSEEYMRAADELGMMIQAEAPRGFGKREWLDILYACRKHPSVVIYCCGNEELLNEDKVKFLREMSDLCHTHAPDALFNPQEAMRGIEYHFDETPEEVRISNEENMQDPFPHNARRLNSVREFSDVFGQYPLGLLSYHSIDAKRATLDKRLTIYERPCLSHEIGILGSYLNLDLESRYEGTRIGMELFAGLRQYLKREGLLSRAPLYYRNSCRWMQVLRKHCVEMARKCRYISGYDFLGATDHHWHRCGYPCGIMNEFYELKPGESVRDILEYNGESLLLLDHTNDRNLRCGQVISLDLYSSLFGGSDIREGKVFWYLADSSRRVYMRGESVVESVPEGRPEKLATVKIEAPDLARPDKLTLFVGLSGGEYELENKWDFWVFPDLTAETENFSADEQIVDKFKDLFPGASEGKGSRIVSRLNEDTINFLAGGGQVILLGPDPFPTLPTTYQIAVSGRNHGNLATVIEDHPLMNTFPHEGFCDWQFFNMLESGKAVVFNEFTVPFDPIIEVVSSFKLIRKQAALFELCVSGGKLLVCTLNLDPSDPAAEYLLKSIINYVNGGGFIPRTHMSADGIRSALKDNIKVDHDFSTDEALDKNAHLSI